MEVGLRIGLEVGLEVEIETEVKIGVTFLTNEFIVDSIEWLDISRIGFIVEIEDTVGRILSELKFNESEEIEETGTVPDVEFPFRNSEEETVGKKSLEDEDEYSLSITVELKS